MTWNLFLDDERFPPNDGREWVIARSYGDALVQFALRGFPTFVSFDHDLGQEENGYDVAKFLVEADIKFREKESYEYKFSPDFDFYVHSQNPIGKANIEGLLNNYLKVKNEH